VIKAIHNSDKNIYIQSATLNGAPFTANWIDYKTIMRGGELVFQMGDRPAINRAVRESDLPFSLSRSEDHQVPER